MTICISSYRPHFACLMNHVTCITSSYCVIRTLICCQRRMGFPSWVWFLYEGFLLFNTSLLKTDRFPVKLVWINVYWEKDIQIQFLKGMVTFTVAQQMFVTQSNNFNWNQLNIELSKVKLKNYNGLGTDSGSVSFV